MNQQIYYTYDRERERKKPIGRHVLYSEWTLLPLSLSLSQETTRAPILHLTSASFHSPGPNQTSQKPSARPSASSSSHTGFLSPKTLLYHRQSIQAATPASRSLGHASMYFYHLGCSRRSDFGNRKQQGGELLNIDAEPMEKNESG